ncbi:MAG TPA: hypothetical protein VH951_01035 [Dehalococcoidia bacterium]
MAERHRDGRTAGFGRGRDAGREGRPRREGGAGREGSEGRESRGSREMRDNRSRRGSGGGEGYGGGFGGPPPDRERRAFGRTTTEPPPTEDQFEEVDADLAVAILETAARLTEIVGTAGLPEGYVERREAVLETFQATYYQVLEIVTGGEESDT